MTLLGYITKKEETNISVFGDKGERIVGGKIGDVVVKDDDGALKILKQEEWELLNQSKKTTKAKQESLNV